MTDARRPRLLIVDDEQDILDFLERALRRRYEVCRFSCPVQALAALETADFDVLITDQKMPELTGLELLDTVARRWPATVRVLISGYTEVADLAHALGGGQIHNFVLKPVDSETLLAAIATAQERATAA